MKKLEVNESVCIGCGACVAIDPEHFDFNDNGLSTVICNENLESMAVTNAIESCPTNAISISEECECHDSCDCGQDCNCTSEEKCSPNCSCDN